MVPLPNFRVWDVDPSERLVMVPSPNFWVIPLMDLPSLVWSVVMNPLPNFLVCDVVPSDQRVIVPSPNLLVMPVIVLPSLVFSVVIDPSPNFLVWEDVPSVLLVIVPSPNFWVMPVLGLAGIGSAAYAETQKAMTAEKVIKPRMNDFIDNSFINLDCTSSILLCNRNYLMRFSLYLTLIIL